MLERRSTEALAPGPGHLNRPSGATTGLAVADKRSLHASTAINFIVYITTNWRKIAVGAPGVRRGDGNGLERTVAVTDGT
jgi:hypothetical protein